jgi:hypothetical protein
MPKAAAAAAGSTRRGNSSNQPRPGAPAPGSPTTPAVDPAVDEDEEPDGPGGARAAADRAGAAADKGAGFLSRGSWSPTLSPPSRARDAGGFAFGLLVYTAAITYIRYGPKGWTGWLSAKFLNKPIQGLPSAKGGPPAKTPKDVQV